MPERCREGTDCSKLLFLNKKIRSKGGISNDAQTVSDSGSTADDVQESMMEAIWGPGWRQNKVGARLDWLTTPSRASPCGGRWSNSSAIRAPALPRPLPNSESGPSSGAAFRSKIRWRGPESNRRHHEFQSLRTIRMICPGCRACRRRRVAEVAGGFQGFWVALGDEIWGCRPMGGASSLPTPIAAWLDSRSSCRRLAARRRT